MRLDATRFAKREIQGWEVLGAGEDARRRNGSRRKL